MFRDSLRDFLAAHSSPEQIRALWETETGRDPEMLRGLAELGLPGMLVPTEQGGLGLTETDCVLLAEECGFAALPESIMDTVLLTAPLLAELGGELAEQYLPGLLAGELRVVLAPPGAPCIADAHLAALALLSDGESAEKIYALPLPEIALQRVHSVDPSRRLYTLEDAPDWRERAELVARGKGSRALWAVMELRGALGCAAQLLGVSRRMLDMAVEYTTGRKQFGVPVGSFQAVKHRLANVAVEIEFARPLAWRAAASQASQHPQAALHTAQAFCAAAQTGLKAVENCVQVHGAMGVTWEMDLHIWMKRAWVLEKCWGGQALHKRRMMDFLLDESSTLGAGTSFA